MFVMTLSYSTWNELFGFECPGLFCELKKYHLIKYFDLKIANLIHGGETSCLIEKSSVQKVDYNFKNCHKLVKKLAKTIVKNFQGTHICLLYS